MSLYEQRIDISPNGLTFLYTIGIIIQYYCMGQVGRQIISKKVQELRAKAGLSKEGLSLKLGFDNSYISKLENCKINISIDRLEAIANFFSIQIRDFFS